MDGRNAARDVRCHGHIGLTGYERELLWYCLIVKPKKSKPTFPLHSSLRSRVWANRVLASFSSSPMPFNHSWIASLHRCMPSHVLLNTTKSSAYWMQCVWWVTCFPPLELFPGPPACFTTASRP